MDPDDDHRRAFRKALDDYRCVDWHRDAENEDRRRVLGLAVRRYASHPECATCADFMEQIQTEDTALRARIAVVEARVGRPISTWTSSEQALMLMMEHYDLPERVSL